MIAYILKSATCLALLLAFYHFVLEKEKMHNFNRYYLLGSILFSFLVPLYIIYIDVAPLVLETTENALNYVPTNVSASEIVYEESINYMQIVIGIYLLVSSILLIRFGTNLYKIIHKIRKNTKIDFQKARLVLVDDKILPHTFWNYIFINKNDYENQKIEQELFTHELTHVTQKHTLDVLILELTQIVFWINPFFILLKKAVQLNHEFLADETVINQHKNTFQYQHLLLNKAAWNNEYYLASNLNYSLTKKRLEMMTTQSSHTKILLKKLAVIPLLTGFIFLFAQRVEAQEIIEVKQDPTETIVEKVSVNQKKKSEKEIYEEYARRNHFYTFKDKNGKKINKKYSELTKEEKARLVPPPPLKSKKKTPTQELIEKLKDGKKYAIWIDEKVVKNNVLNNYKASDFSSHFVSFVYKNARSKRFPQNYQAHLSTNTYFENQNKKRVINFKKYLKEERTVVEVQETPKFNKNWFITIDGQKYYYTFDKKEKIARYYLNGKLINLDVVKEYKKKHKIFENLKSKGKHYVFKSLKEQKVIDREFSDLGGMYFRMPKVDKNKVQRPENSIRPYVKLRKFDKVWYKKRDELTAEDKLLLPPPPPVPNASKKQILEAKKAYQDWKKRVGIELPPPPPSRKKIKESEEQELKEAENRRLAHEKSHRKTSNSKPIVTGGKMKTSLLETVKKWREKDARFLYNKKPITGKNAINLVSKNKNLRIYSVGEKIDKPTLVFISDKS